MTSFALLQFTNFSEAEKVAAQFIEHGAFVQHLPRKPGSASGAFSVEYLGWISIHKEWDRIFLHPYKGEGSVSRAEILVNALYVFSTAMAPT